MDATSHGHAAGHDSGGHGHLKLAYQPALPISIGKLIIWLFLSTEIMFFAGLIGTYIVLRFGASAWPRPHEVHLIEVIGAFNTFVLICSSVSIVLALEAARTDNASSAKMWMVVTLVLGSVFLLVKAYEYNAKFSHGIYPWLPHSRVYEKADLDYASAVRLRLASLKVEFESAKPEEPTEPSEPTYDNDPAIAAKQKKEFDGLRTSLARQGKLRQKAGPLQRERGPPAGPGQRPVGPRVEGRNNRRHRPHVRGAACRDLEPGRRNRPAATRRRGAGGAER